jgi:hypothetical protein
MITSSIMTKLIQCQERLKAIKLIEILNMKEWLIHLFWDIVLNISNDNLHNDNKSI